MQEAQHRQLAQETLIIDYEQADKDRRIARKPEIDPPGARDIPRSHLPYPVKAPPKEKPKPVLHLKTKEASASTGSGESSKPPPAPPDKTSRSERVGVFESGQQNLTGQMQFLCRRQV